MSSRVSVFTKDGYLLGDVRASTRRSWVLPRTGVVGQCEFDISAFDRHANKKYLGWGKYLLVRHETLLPWIGVIYTPRSWSFGRRKIRAYQAEKILEWRRTPSQKFTGTAGSIFRQALQYTNAAMNNEKPIRPNIIFEDKNSREETFGNDALSHIKSLVARSGQDYEVTHTFDANGRLYLVGNWYERKGIETGRTFREGFNMEEVDNVMEESGDLWNDVTGMSDSSTQATRLTFTSYNDAAIAENGLYQKGVVFSGVSQQATLEQNVLEYLKRTAAASRQFDINAIDVNNEFKDLAPGNYWGVDMNYEGFDGQDGEGAQAKVQILGMEYDDANPKRARIISEEML
jgi:hypothetical protein